MDIERICRTRLSVKSVREKEANGGDVGHHRFVAMVRDAKAYGYLVPGNETLSLSLWLSAIFGDDSAAYALRDLYSEAGMDAKADVVENRLSGMRHAITTWSPATKKTFLRHCREKGVFRQRDLVAK